MNKNKRGLIMAAAIINIISVSATLILSILYAVYGETLLENEFFYYVSYFLSFYISSIVYAVISFAIGVAGSVLLLYAVRDKGKYFRRSQGLYATGLIITIFCGSFLSWILLFISMFIPDVIVMNSRSEIREETRQEMASEKQREKEMEEKKKKIDELKNLRDTGVITEEEYKQKLFDIL